MRELTFRDYLRIIRKRKWWIVAFTVLIPVGVLFIAPKRQIFVYEAEATIKVSPVMPVATVTGGQITWWETSFSIRTEVELIKSTRVVERAARNLGIIEDDAPSDDVIKTCKSLIGKIKTERVEYTDFIVIKVRDTNPHFAAAFANGLAKAYTEEHLLERNRQAVATREFLEQQLEDKELALRDSEGKLRWYQEENAEFFALADGYKRRLASVNRSISELTNVYTSRHHKVEILQKDADEIRQNLKDFPQKQQSLGRLEEEVTRNKSLYNRIREKLIDARIAEQVGVEEVTLTTPAIPPTSPINPTRKANVGVGIIAGLILGFIFAFVSESLDTSIATIDEIESYLGVPVLGVIPGIKRERTDHKEQFPLLIRRLSDKPFFEPYDTLSTNIDFARAGKPGKTFLITSTIPGEGKTIISINTAITMASIGKKTLLVDADMKRASIHKVFNMEKKPGFTDMVFENMELSEVVKGVSHFVVSGVIKKEDISRIPGIDNLYVMGCGHIPPNPIQMIESANMSRLIDKLKEEFDVIIFDTTPTLTTAITTILASKIDWVILVYEVGKVPRGSLRRAVTSLSHAKAKVLGVVLNKMRATDLEAGASYYYSYKYYPEERRRAVTLLAHAKARVLGVVLNQMRKLPKIFRKFRQ